MNRTKEYQHFISTFNTPQKNQPSEFIINPFIELQASITHLTSIISTESHNKIKTSIASLENKLQKFTIIDNFGNCTHTNESIKQYLNSAHKCAYLNLQRIKDAYANRLKKEKLQRQKYISSDNTTKGKNSNNEMSSNQVVMQEHDICKQRQTEIQTRIEDQITEIGQIFTDITLHIHAQGETLMRIDDMMIVNDEYLRGSDYNIRRTWDILNGRRHGMFVYFLVWILILFVVFLVKKIFQ